MKKHILGFAIFSFIFASFAFAFTYFYAPPIPQISEVKIPVYQFESRNTCRKKRSTATNIKYEIISAQYFYNQNKIISKIKLTWNGVGDAPSKINIVAKIGTSDELSNERIISPQFFDKPFLSSNFSIVELVIDNLGTERFDRKKNLYADFTIFDENSDTDNPDTFGSMNPTSVVFVHEGEYVGLGSGRRISSR